MNQCWGQKKGKKWYLESEKYSEKTKHVQSFLKW